MSEQRRTSQTQVGSSNVEKHYAADKHQRDDISHFQQEARQGTVQDEVEKEIHNDGSNTPNDANCNYPTWLA